MSTLTRTTWGAGVLWLCVVGGMHVEACDPNFTGYLGVYVTPTFGGMQIEGFIRGTPAARLAERGGLDRYDVIVRLGGRPTGSRFELQEARDRIPLHQEAKMVLRDRFGDRYHVWIRRQAPAVAARAASPLHAADEFRFGGRGDDVERDFREPGDDDGADERPDVPDRRFPRGIRDPGEFRDPPGGRDPRDRRGPRNDGPDFRDIRDGGGRLVPLPGPVTTLPGRIPDFVRPR